MVLLALDTTTAAGSVALWRDGLIEERAGDPGAVARRAPAGRSWRSAAPRTAWRPRTSSATRSPPGPARSPACASASPRSRGWRSSTSGSSHAVGTLELLAHDAARAGDAVAGTTIIAWMEAYRGEVFAARYRIAHGAAARRRRPRRRSRRAVRRSSTCSIRRPSRPPEPLAGAWARTAHRRSGRSRAIIVTGDGVARTHALLAACFGPDAALRVAGAAGRHAGARSPRRHPDARDAAARHRADLRAASGRRARPRSRRACVRRRDGRCRCPRRRRSISPAPSSSRDLDGILAVDAATFDRPWTRAMYEWEWTPLRRGALPRRPARGRRRRLLRRLGDLRRAARQQPGRRSGVAAARRGERAPDVRAARRPRPRAPSARRWRCGARTRRRGGSTSGSGSPSPASARPTTANRWKMRSSCGATAGPAPAPGPVESGAEPAG